MCALRQPPTDVSVGGAIISAYCGLPAEPHAAHSTWHVFLDQRLNGKKADLSHVPVIAARACVHEEENSLKLADKEQKAVPCSFSIANKRWRIYSPSPSALARSAMSSSLKRHWGCCSRLEIQKKNVTTREASGEPSLDVPEPSFNGEGASGGEEGAGGMGGRAGITPARDGAGAITKKRLLAEEPKRRRHRWRLRGSYLCLSSAGRQQQPSCG